MWLYLNEHIKRLHRLGDATYIIDDTGAFYFLDKIQGFIVEEIQNSSGGAITKPELISKTNSAFAVHDLELTQKVIDSILSCLSEVFVATPEYRSASGVTVSGEKTKSYPYNLEVSLTNRCPNFCKHCFKSAGVEGRDISYKELSELLCFCKGKTPFLTLTGGEPFMYKEIASLIEQWGAIYRILVTTSTLGVDRLSDAHIKSIAKLQISLYGANAEEHDSFVQRTGSFVRSLGNIKRIMNLNQEVILVTQAKSNAKEPLEAFVQLAISLGIKDLVIGEISPIGRATELHLHDTYDTEIVDNNILALRRKYASEINILHDSGDSGTANAQSPSNLYFKCGAGKLQWHITESGTIMPCSFFPYSIFDMGTLEKESYKELVCTQKFEGLNCNWWKLPLETTQAYTKICEKIGG